MYGTSALCGAQKPGTCFIFHCEAMKVKRKENAASCPWKRWGGCFQPCAAANSAVISDSYIPFCMSPNITPGCIYRSRRAGAKAVRICNFNAYYQIAFLGDCNNESFYQQCIKVTDQKKRVTVRL